MILYTNNNYGKFNIKEEGKIDFKNCAKNVPFGKSSLNYNKYEHFKHSKSRFESQNIPVDRLIGYINKIISIVDKYVNNISCFNPNLKNLTLRDLLHLREPLTADERKIGDELLLKFNIDRLCENIIKYKLSENKLDMNKYNINRLGMLEEDNDKNDFFRFDSKRTRYEKNKVAKPKIKGDLKKNKLNKKDEQLVDASNLNYYIKYFNYLKLYYQYYLSHFMSVYIFYKTHNNVTSDSSNGNNNDNNMGPNNRLKSLVVINDRETHVFILRKLFVYLRKLMVLHLKYIINVFPLSFVYNPDNFINYNSFTDYNEVINNKMNNLSDIDSALKAEIRRELFDNSEMDKKFSVTEFTDFLQNSNLNVGSVGDSDSSSGTATTNLSGASNANTIGTNITNATGNIGNHSSNNISNPYGIIQPVCGLGNGSGHFANPNNMGPFLQNLGVNFTLRNPIKLESSPFNNANLIGNLNGSFGVPNVNKTSDVTSSSFNDYANSLLSARDPLTDVFGVTMNDSTKFAFGSTNTGHISNINSGKTTFFNSATNTTNANYIIFKPSTPSTPTSSLSNVTGATHATATSLSKAAASTTNSYPDVTTPNVDRGKHSAVTSTNDSSSNDTNNRSNTSTAGAIGYGNTSGSSSSSTPANNDSASYSSTNKDGSTFTTSFTSKTHPLYSKLEKIPLKQEQPANNLFPGTSSVNAYKSSQAPKKSRMDSTEKERLGKELKSGKKLKSSNKFNTMNIKQIFNSISSKNEPAGDSRIVDNKHIGYKSKTQSAVTKHVVFDVVKESHRDKDRGSKFSDTQSLSSIESLDE